MMIKLTTDYDMIKKMLTEDLELFDRISDDYTDISKWEPGDSWWIGYFEGGECLALLSAHDENAIVLIVHIHIPSKNRGKNSFKMGNDMLEWLIKNCNKRFVKINAKIPVIYPDVIKYAEKNGFDREGTDRQSFIKNGKIHDKAIMGRVLNG